MAMALLREISFGKDNHSLKHDALSDEFLNVKSSIIHEKTNSLEHFSNNNGKIQNSVLSDGFQKIREATGLLSDNRTGYRLLGVGITNLDHGDERQLSIFDYYSDTLEEKKELDRENRLDKMEDEIKKRFGESAIHKGT